MKTQKVLLALSGGVDSSIAALLLKKQGYEVIGAFMKNFSGIINKLTGECNWIQEKEMAQKIASILNIKFITLDFEKQYINQVVNPMFKSYSQGLTPNPDIACNTIIKFPLLWKEAQKIKADYIATGHYARIKKTKNNTYLLLKGKDKTKDQSYFLSELTQKDLSHTLFPIGNLTKTQVRAMAKKHKLPNWNKKGTRGICFIGKIPMKSFLERKIKQKKGPVLNPEGKIIGTHKGIMFYTIGERVGISKGIILEKESNIKHYIADKNKRSNSLIIAPENHPLLKKGKFIIKNLHIINKNYKIKAEIGVRIRHLGPIMKSKIKKHNKKYLCTLNKAIPGLAEGQYAVLYDKGIVVASGEISYN